MQTSPFARIYDGVALKGSALDYLDEALPHLADDAVMEVAEKEGRRWHDAPTPRVLRPDRSVLFGPDFR